jgi:hypothetical protein
VISRTSRSLVMVGVLALAGCAVPCKQWTADTIVIAPCVDREAALLDQSNADQTLESARAWWKVHNECERYYEKTYCALPSVGVEERGK